MAKDPFDLPVTELNQIAGEASLDAARKSLAAGITVKGARPDGSLYSINPDGVVIGLPEEEAEQLRVRLGLARKRTKQAVA